jgi:hypothetical protein
VSAFFFLFSFFFLFFFSLQLEGSRKDDTEHLIMAVKSLVNGPNGV